MEDKNQELININPLIEIDVYAKYSVCGININNNPSGTGFLCKIPDPEKTNKTMIALFTCNHFLPINKDNLNNYKDITFQLQNKEKEPLPLEDGRRIWIDKEINDNDQNSFGNLDYTCIEIFPKNQAVLFGEEKLEIFKIDEQTLENQNPKDFKKIGIKAFTFSEKNFRELNGNVNSLEEKRGNYFSHNLNTEESYSGSPIINNINGNIIGIHMGNSKPINLGNKGIGMILKKIYNHMKKNTPIKVNNGYPKCQKTELFNIIDLKKKNHFLFYF